MFLREGGVFCRFFGAGYFDINDFQLRIALTALKELGFVLYHLDGLQLSLRFFKNFFVDIVCAILVFDFDALKFKLSNFVVFLFFTATFAPQVHTEFISGSLHNVEAKYEQIQRANEYRARHKGNQQCEKKFRDPPALLVF